RVRAVPARPSPAVNSPSTAASAVAPGWVIPSWTTILRVLWAAGAMLQLGFLGWQLLRLRRIQRAGVPWLEGREIVRMLAGECGVRKSVDILLHEDIAAPVPSGGFRPVILLPLDINRWNQTNFRPPSIT